LAIRGQAVDGVRRLLAINADLATEPAGAAFDRYNTTFEDLSVRGPLE
jgi:hypothetical protein